jgi:serine/threonine protein phosphatase 1
MLKRLMDVLSWEPDVDHLIFLGDYIDRGKDSRGVVDYILDLKRASRLVRCLRGNHEDIFLDFLRRRDIQTFLVNGGFETLESYRINHQDCGENSIPQEHRAFFESLESWVELDEYYVVHAGFRPKVPLEEQTAEDIVWIRDPFIYSDYNFGKKVVFGHTPFMEPLVMANKIGLDTGAVYGNKLTCLELPLMKFHCVDA